jgi:hypothetical protein
VLPYFPQVSEAAGLDSESLTFLNGIVITKTTARVMLHPRFKPVTENYGGTIKL